MNWGVFLGHNAWQLVLMACLLVGSAFFSGSETAFFSLSAAKLHHLERTPAGALVTGLMRNRRKTLNTILLGNMLVNVGFAAFSAMLVVRMKRMDASSLVLAFGTVLPLVLLILVGEISPKAIALVWGPRWSIAAAAPLAVAQKVLAPLVWLMDGVIICPLTRLSAPRALAPAAITADELAAALEISAKRGVIDRHANSLLQEIVELTDLRVGDVMVPRVDMVAYDVNAPPEGLAELFRRTHLRKIPVFNGDMDNILGVIHAKRLLLQSRPPELRQLVAHVPFVPEPATLERTLAQFRQTRTQMAVVVDEYGGTAGLITLEDILEEIVGDIPDKHEIGQVPPVRQIRRNLYMVNGDLGIHDLAEALGIDLSGRRISTVSGFVTSLLGRIPMPHDEICYRNLRFEVQAMRRRRVEKVSLKLLEENA